MGPQVRLLIRSFTLPRWRYTEEMTKDRLSREDPIGTCGRDGNTDDGSPESAGIQLHVRSQRLLQKVHSGARHQHAYNDSWFCKDQLRPVQPMHPRIGTVIVQSGTASMPQAASMSRTTMSGANFRTLGRYLQRTTILLSKELVQCGTRELLCPGYSP